MRVKTFAAKTILLALFLTILSQGYAHADSFNITVNTSGLGAGESEIFFLLIGTGANTATLNNNLTENIVSPAPDQFALAILDPSGSFVPSSDPTGSGNLLAFNIDSPTLSPNIYSDLVTVTAPTPTSEPSSLLLLGGGLLPLAFFWRTTEKRSHSGQRAR